METERRALYNSLRMNWLRDPACKVEHWQVENLRDSALADLLKRVDLEQGEFLALAENFESPEEMVEELAAPLDLPLEEFDRLYLAVFELWRRLVPEKQTLSIFCDELDHQIHLYDTGQLQNIEAFQDALDNLLQILNENADAGLAPKSCSETIQALAANDIEAFLYDYLSEEIDQGHTGVARDYVEGFYPYILDKKWFDFLALRLKVLEEDADLESELQPLLKKAMEDPLDFYFEILLFLAQHGDIKTFSQVAKKVIAALKTEEDFRYFIEIAAEFYHFLDDEEREKELLDSLQGRNRPLDALFNPQDPLLFEIKKIIF